MGIELERTETAKSADRHRLIQIIRDRSFQSGREIRLASGKLSTIYFNLKPTMLHPEGAFLIASLLLDAIDGTDADLIGGLELGAVPLASAVAAVSTLRGQPLAAFIVRKEVKGHGTRSLVEGLGFGETLAGRRVIIVEDVTTTGGSAIKAATIARDNGAEVISVMTVIDRGEGAAEAFAEAGLTFRPLLSVRDFVA